MKAINFGDPLVWRLFRDMYADARDSHDLATQGTGPVLLDALKSLLRRRVKALMEAGRDQLRQAVRRHIDVNLKRVADRDFTRLISARLTFREIHELEKFLDHRGYAMDIDRYINGK